VVQRRVAERIKHLHPSTPTGEELLRLVQSEVGAFAQEIEAQFVETGIVVCSCGFQERRVNRKIHAHSRHKEEHRQRQILRTGHREIEGTVPINNQQRKPQAFLRQAALCASQGGEICKRSSYGRVRTSEHLINKGILWCEVSVVCNPGTKSALRRWTFIYLYTHIVGSASEVFVTQNTSSHRRNLSTKVQGFASTIERSKTN
jgi:hypothetical protein